MIKHRRKISLAIGLYWSLSHWIFAQSSELLVINDDLQLLPLTENLYLHISWLENEEYGRFSSNGMVYIQNEQALIVDTPMEEELTVALASYIQEKLHARISLAIPGHFHGDCVNGLPYLHSLGARSIAGKRTQTICREKGLVVPQKSFKRKKTIHFQGKSVTLAYFGAGHAPDNIVVWFPEEKVLFGGCLIRSLETTTLGNTGDAVLEEWAPTVTKVQRAFPAVKTVVPGHGPVGNGALLQHTINLTRHVEAK